MSNNREFITDPAAAPTMYYCLDNIGGYDGFFDGEHVLASAGVAYRNPGSDRFSLGVPTDPASLIVDSGGFQAATRWNGVEACERGLHGRYPYSPTELHEWAEEIGADVVAGMDVACETAMDLFGADGLEKGYIWPGDYRDRLLESLDYQRRQQRVYEAGEYSHALMPVIQGNTLADYEHFMWLLQSEGLDQYDRLALGTVCKRTDRDTILEIVQLVREYYPDKHLHLFGATRRIWEDARFHGLFDSSDTAAWNWGGRSKAHKKTLFREYASNVAQCQQTIAQQTRFGEDPGVAVERPLTDNR
jgi:hypothetical protein